MKSDDAEILADMFKLLGDATRLRTVLACLNTAYPVGTIAEMGGLSRPLASHHLRLLKHAGLVRSERKGKQVFYSVADSHIAHMLGDMLEHAKHCLPALTSGTVPDRLRRRSI